MEKVLIIGSGVAALEAAAALRAAAPETAIAICTREAVRPYRRPALPRLIGGDLPDTQFFIKPAAFFTEQRIRLETGRTAVRLDRDRHEVHFADGSTESYDRLLLAVGGRCFRPSIPGIDLPGVLTLREYADLAPLREAIRGAGTAAVLGGGLLGLELADALRSAGCRIAIVEGLNTLLPRQLDEAAANTAARHLRAMDGVSLHLGSFPTAIRGERAAEAVELADGTVIPASPVVVSAGMRPNTELAAAAGLAAGKNGIEVDRLLRTADPSVFAAGDCAAVDGAPNCGLYPAARDMGAAAGRNLAGQTQEYRPRPCPARMLALGLKLSPDGDRSRLEVLSGRG